MAAGINGASNSEANKRKTTDYDARTGELVSSTKTPRQQQMSAGVERIKTLTNHGKHKEASDLYKKLFPSL